MRDWVGLSACLGRCEEENISTLPRIEPKFFGRIPKYRLSYHGSVLGIIYVKYIFKIQRVDNDSSCVVLISIELHTEPPLQTAQN